MTLRWEQGRSQGPVESAPFHTVTLPNGTPWTEFYRIDNGYVLRFPGLADFEVSADALEVVCFPASKISIATAEHLYLNQVLPLVLGKRGKLVFHASAVEIGSEAVAFVAVSGRGKSTLAASFATNGFRFLTDDGLVLERDDQGFVVQPSHPSIRLWEDSREALLPTTTKTPALDYTYKARFFQADDDSVFCNKPRPLRKVYFLGDGSATVLDVRSLSAAGAFAEWLQHSFLLDVEERPRLASHFDQVAALAKQAIHYHLDYPRRYDELDRVRESIVDHVRASAEQ
jgi:hypothetical protein